jgi:hypothetical protein
MSQVQFGKENGLANAFMSFNSFECLKRPLVIEDIPKPTAGTGEIVVKLET